MGPHNVRKTVIWYDDHLTPDDEDLLAEPARILSLHDVVVIPAPTQSEFAEVLRSNATSAPSISGLILDLMLTSSHSVRDWSVLGFPNIEFSPYIAGRQVLEILRLPRYVAKAPPFVTAFTGHSVAVLTAAQEDIVFENLPRTRRSGIRVIFKDDDNFEENMCAWIKELPTTV